MSRDLVKNLTNYAETFISKLEDAEEFPVGVSLQKYHNLLILDTKNVKYVRSEEKDYHYVFVKETGFFAEWGKKLDDEVVKAPCPNIADIELTDICFGVKGDGAVCPFCYKSNLPTNDSYMSFETFKEIFDKLPPTICQIAFGTDANLKPEANPDYWEIFEYTRAHGVTPNVTVANVDEEIAKRLSKIMGAVAVSRYDDKNYCYDTVKRLTDLEMDQVNIHVMLSKETLNRVFETLEDRVKDPRLSKMKAIVILSLKQKGRGENYHNVSEEEFKQVIDKALELGVSIGFDSCSAPLFAKSVKESPDYDEYMESVMSCESTLESMYCNCKGEFYPCSFSEVGEGQDLKTISDFKTEIWESEKTEVFRRRLCNNIDENKCRNCPLYNI